MAINCYSGLMGTGKSYEVVSSVVVQAVAAGRRVVSNISGLNNEAVREYVARKHSLQDDAIGCIVNVTDEQVSSLSFFPCKEAAEGAETDSIVKPGDLVAIDEAYKIWGTDVKIHRQHLVFFREHRHYTHPETGVSCDLVLMTQDIADLHRSLRSVIGNSFKTHKAKGIGFDNLYTITMWEGWKQPAKHIVKDWTKTYDPEIFPLYKSYAGTKQGKELNADARMNIFADRRMRMKIIFFVLVVGFILYRLGSFWWAKTHPEESKPPAPAPAASSGPKLPPIVGAVPPSGKVVPADVSADYRIVGNLVANGVQFVILSGRTGIRVEPSAAFVGTGFLQSGMVDGQSVTRFSGSAASEGSK